MTSERISRAITEADVVADLLDHSGWIDIIRPRLEEHKTAYRSQLVNSVLGAPVVTHDGIVVSSEQLAGRIYGIDYAIRTIENIIRNGQRAIAQL
jgi:hypothetical protein